MQHTSDNRWNDRQHLSTAWSKEHLALEIAQAETGHVWQATPLGEFKYFELDNGCEGPRCELCGASICVKCQDLAKAEPCSYGGRILSRARFFTDLGSNTFGKSISAGSGWNQASSDQHSE